MYSQLRKRLAANARLKKELGQQIRGVKSECRDSGRSVQDEGKQGEADEGRAHQGTPGTTPGQ